MKKFIEEITSDLSGEGDAATVRVSLDFEIDLTPAERDEWNAFIGKYVKAGRRVGAFTVSHPAGTYKERQEARQWLRENGYTVPDKGVLKKTLMDAYIARTPAPKATQPPQRGLEPPQPEPAAPEPEAAPQVRPVRPGASRAEIRAWLNANGYTLRPTGNISKFLQDAAFSGRPASVTAPPAVQATTTKITKTARGGKSSTVPAAAFSAAA